MEAVKVFVVDAAGKPLLPTHPARARKLLNAGKATVFQVVPFTIQLMIVVEAPVGGFTLGIDDGAKAAGIAVINDQASEVVFAGMIQLRQDVSRKMEQRRNYRRVRRSRKLRHRPTRFSRKKGDGWLPPTIRQKKESIVRLVSDLRRILPITQVVVEQGEFDTSSLAAGRPLQGIEYQILRHEGRDFRAKVLWRDGYTCQHCGSREHLQAHHILPKSEGGTNTPHNGLTLCADCHQASHNGEWALNIKPSQFHYPAHLQVGKHYLTSELERLGLSVTTCVGWMTHYWRQQLGLDKSHVHDAVAMVCRTFLPRFCCRPYVIIPKRKKVWENNPTKSCTEKHGFRHWDVVKASHRTPGTVIGSIRSLKASAITLRTAWDDNFPVAYSKTRLLWRFSTIVYI